MNLIRKIVLFSVIVILAIPFSAYAFSHNPDSLKKMLNTKLHDSVRVEGLYLLGYLYGAEDSVKAEACFSEAEQLSRKSHPKLLPEIYRHKAV